MRPPYIHVVKTAWIHKAERGWVWVETEPSSEVVSLPTPPVQFQNSLTICKHCVPNDELDGLHHLGEITVSSLSIISPFVADRSVYCCLKEDLYLYRYRRVEVRK